MLDGLMLSLLLLAAPGDSAPAAAAPQPALALAPAVAAQGGLCSGAPALALASTARKPGDPQIQDTCFEDCDGLPDIQCSGQFCSAQNRNCGAGQQGYVVCDGNYTFCAEECEPPQCTLFQCRQPCKVPGCFSQCVDLENCICETICQ